MRRACDPKLNSGRSYLFGDFLAFGDFLSLRCGYVNHLTASPTFGRGVDRRLAPCVATLAPCVATLATFRIDESEQKQAFQVCSAVHALVKCWETIQKAKVDLCFSKTSKTKFSRQATLK